MHSPAMIAALSSGFNDVPSDKTAFGFKHQFSPTSLDRPDLPPMGVPVFKLMQVAS